MTTSSCRPPSPAACPSPPGSPSPTQLWAPWQLEGDALAEGKRDAVRLALSRPGARRHRHRHRRRADPPPFRDDVHRGLDGVDFEHEDRAHPQPLRRRRADGRRPGRAPAARLRRRRAVPARRDTTRKVKFTLPGPMTMVDTLYDAHYGSREKLALAFAEILNDEAREIEAAGVDVIQFDEPAFNVYFDEVRDWGVAALERAAQGLRCTTAVHICYGYGIKANIDWKKTLGDEWRQYEQTFPAARAVGDRPGVARVRELARADRAHRPPRRQGRAGRGDRRRDRPDRDARGGRRDDPRRAAPRSRRAPLPVHQLRDGAARPGGRPGQARGAGGGRGAGPGRA